MRLAKLSIARFRGIKSLEWSVDGRVTCLVGPGDTGKTTVLDAISLLGSSRTPSFSDSDFFGGSVEAGSIVVEGVLTDLPPSLLSDNRFGLDLVGLGDDGEVLDEPGDSAPAIRVRVDVDASLEPVWTLVSVRNPDGRLLSARDRADLFVSRLGTGTDRQFSFARGSALSRAVADRSEVSSILSDAYRTATAAVRSTDLSALKPAVEGAAKTARTVGAGSIADEMSIGLELSPASSGGLSLHTSNVPVGGAGLGTRRLLALGLELGNAESSGVLCIDEIETGLEPHRIRHLVSTLSQLVGAVDEPQGGHVLFTTHSPIVLGELGAEGVGVLRTDEGAVEVRSVAPELTGLIRSTPDALLAPRVVIGEGKTEVGLLRAFDRAWTEDHGGRSLAQLGIAVVDGGGHSAPSRSRQLAELGYPVLLLADSDAALDPTEHVLRAAGVTVVQWADEMSTEQRVLSDISWDGVTEAFDMVVAEDREPEHVIDAILGSAPAMSVMSREGIVRGDVGNTLDSLLEVGFSASDVRAAFAAAAKSKANAWFKRIDWGQELGQIAIDNPSATGAPFATSIGEVERWCHG